MTCGLLVVWSANNNHTMYVPNVVVNDIHLLQVFHRYSFTYFQCITIFAIILYYSSATLFASVLVSISEQ